MVVFWSEGCAIISGLRMLELGWMVSFHVKRTGWKLLCVRDLVSEARASAIILSMEQKLSSLSYTTGRGFGAAGGGDELVVVSITRVLVLLLAGSVLGGAGMVELAGVGVVVKVGDRRGAVG